MAGAAFSRQGNFGGLFGQNAAVVQPASTVLLPVVGSVETGAEQALVPDTGGAPQAVAGVACPLPDGWIPYTVNPTDSLFRLSILNGVTLDQIRSVNCLSEDAVLLPGQVIYVPKMAAATITPFIEKILPTSVPLLIVNPPAQAPQPEPVNNDDGNKDEEPAPAPQPPPATPTAVAPVQPTNPPPAPAPTDTPPPNSGGRDDGDDHDRGKGNDGDRGGDKGDKGDKGGGGKDKGDGKGGGDKGGGGGKDKGDGKGGDHGDKGGGGGKDKGDGGGKGGGGGRKGKD